MTDFYGGSFFFMLKVANSKLKKNKIFISRDFHNGLPRIEIYKNDVLIKYFNPYVQPDVDSIETEEDEMHLHRQAFIEMIVELIENKYAGEEKSDESKP
jgi:hypothetical protein